MCFDSFCCNLALWAAQSIQWTVEEVRYAVYSETGWWQTVTDRQQTHLEVCCVTKHNRKIHITLDTASTVETVRESTTEKIKTHPG